MLLNGRKNLPVVCVGFDVDNVVYADSDTLIARLEEYLPGVWMHGFPQPLFVAWQSF